MIFIRKHQEVYGNTIEMNQLNPANNNNSILFKLKEKITEQTGANATKHFEITIPLKYIITFGEHLKYHSLIGKLILY